MHDCDHEGTRVYARRVFANGSTHICVQCLRCFSLVKMPRHGNRPFIREDEVPSGHKIREWIENPQRELI